MTYTDKVRITVEVAGHKPAPEDEPADCAAWRRSLEADREKIEAAGHAFAIPSDWE